MTQPTVLTGITTTGIPHLGNYVGAIRPAIEASVAAPAGSRNYLFMADYHALIKCHEPKRVQQSTLAVAAAWLASGLDTQKVTFYRQSDVPEITELSWILTCVAAKGLMNRAHAYKAAVQENVENQAADPDRGITMGLFSYPVLMAADILLFNATHVPVGRDQIQHLEMTRDIAQRFNHLFGETFALPEAVTDESSMVLQGLDGRKMSKSYDNTIALFDTEKNLQRGINKIVTNSLEPGTPKDPESCTLFSLYCAFATAEAKTQMRAQYATGIGWGAAKKQVFEHINALLAKKRVVYNRYMADPAELDRILKQGAERAREYAVPMMADVRNKTGIGPLAGWG